MISDKEETARFRADIPLGYAQAVVRLAEYARRSDEEFEFGPLDMAAMRRSGLVVTGPDLTGITELLAVVPGLAQVSA